MGPPKQGAKFPLPKMIFSIEHPNIHDGNKTNVVFIIIIITITTVVITITIINIVIRTLKGTAADTFLLLS